MEATHGTSAETVHEIQSLGIYKAIVNQTLENFVTSASQNNQQETANNSYFLS